ncbi:response regulator [candidate division KSB1 bacterium]|nr:response regulator [candidate division KSB1 bacterium]
MNRIKTLIIDDEWLIRSELKTMLIQYPNIDVIGEAANLNEAIKLCTDLKPDLVFLDIHLPGGSGFDFLNRMNGDFKLVFITAFDQYLDEAKKYQAIDYLMKPISKAKLSRVIRML